ncbi:MAG: ATP-binding protein [Spirochaetes bacterium]|nr:ATP-binding protein [Spirochaetota bacterium]
MNWFDNLKIKAKMILGFALFIVLITSIVLFAIYRLNDVALTYNNTIKYPVSVRDAIIVTQAAYNDMRTMTNKIAAYAPHDTPEHIDSMYKDAVSAYEQAINTIHEFENLLKTNPLLNEEERSIRLYNADMLEMYVRRYKDEICDPIMNAARAGDYEKAIDILSATDELVKETKSLVSALRELATAVAERSSHNAQVTAGQSKTLLGITSVVSIVISILLALLIASLIANPINNMTNVANNVAKGNLNVNIDTSAKDETGTLAKSFADIVNIVNLLTTDLKNLSKEIQTDSDVDTKLDASHFSGAYGEVVESINTFAASLLNAQKSALLTVSTMFKSNPQINILFDDTFNVIDCNPEAVKFLGFNSREELLDGFHDRVSKSIPEIMSNGQRSLTLDEQLKKTAKEGEAKLETELHFGGGDIRRLSVDLKKIPYKGSFAVVAYVFDLTEVYQREMQLARAKELIELQLAKLNLVVQATKIGLWDMEVVHDDPVNPNNTFIWSNEFRHMLGYTDENDFPNLLSSWSDLLHPEDKERTLNAFANHMLDTTGKTPYDVEYRLLRKTGEYAYYRASGESIRGKDGVAIRVAGALVDITDTKNMLQDKDRQKEEAQAANRAKSTFLANMSHELRTPLNVVIGLTGLIMEDKRLEKHITDNLIKISNAGSTLLSIVNDVLDFSKIESGKLELSPAEYYTASMLNDTVTFTTARIGEKNIKFHLNIDDNLPYKLYGDDLRVKQVFTNLLTNAVKYTDEGSVELNVRCEREGGTVWINASISDTGVGISEDDLKNLFQDYHRIDSKSNHHVEGTGLGLSITKNLIELMDGKIKVESEYGKGSKFSFRIKQGFVSEAVLGADISGKLRNFCYTDDKRVVSQKLVRIDLSYAKVLVVDDITTNLDVAAGILSSYKMQVDCLTSGQAALDRIKSGTPVYNAIFMDHMMPGMDGIETADRIRALGTEYAKKIPVIALTANAIKGTEKIFFEHDFQAFITKPIDIMEMDAVLRKWVRDDTHAEVVIDDDLSELDLQIEKLIIDIHGVDTKKGLSLYAGAKKIYLPMLRSYAHNTPKVLDKLRSVTAENLHDYVITVHGLKGTSAAIGAEHIRAAALELENLSRAGDLQGVIAKNDKLIADTEIIVNNVQEWLDQNDAKKPRQKAPDRELLARLRQCCESYNMSGIDEVMLELDKFDYEEDADLMAWIREKIIISEIGEVAEKLSQY